MNKKVFRFLAKGTVPLRKPIALLPPAGGLELYEEEAAQAQEEANTGLERQVKDLLWRYELAEQERQKLRQKFPQLFDVLERLDQEQKEVKDSLKRLLHTKSGPPDQVRPGASSHVWARGEMYTVEVTYKKKANYYDPTKLPKAVFMMPGVVTEVDKGILDQMAKKDGRIAKALIVGEWMTPAVSIPRLTRDSEPNDE